MKRIRPRITPDIASFPSPDRVAGVFARQKGFTLAELLIAMVILGLIAMFTVPKVLQSNRDGRRKAVFRETIAAYSQAAWEGYANGQFTAGNCATCGPSEYPFNDYFQTRINYLKQCSQAVPGGCYTGTCAQPTGPGQVLATGASTCGLSDKISATYDNFYLDWDGPAKGSGTEGDDQIRVRVCIRSGCPNGQRPGTLIPYPIAASENLYYQIFDSNNY